MRIVCLDSFALDQGAPAWDGLRALGAVTVHPRTPHDARPDEVLARCQGAAAVITNKVPFSAERLAALPDLRYLGVSATGTNIIDLGAARARGVAVTNVPAYGSESVAQMTFALLLALASRVTEHAAAVRAGGWAASPDFCFFVHPLLELAGKTLVVVGKGAIGGAVARIATGFGMNVLAAAVPGSPAQGPRVPLAEALGAADVVSLHCPLTPATERLVDAAFLARCRPTAILINTSRGGLIDEGALVTALRNGHLAGVALDVLGTEPPPATHPLTDAQAPYASRVIVTPHIAWGTAESRARLERETTENLAAFLRGERRNRVD